MPRTIQEMALIKALYWESARLMIDNGPAHILCKEHGLLKRSDPGVLTLVATVGITMDEIDGEQIHHQGWPWPGKTMDEIRTHLKTESGLQASQAEIP